MLVEFGKTTAYGFSASSDAIAITLHDVTLDGLEPSTTYHFRITCKDPSGNVNASDDYTLTTTALAIR